MSRGAEQLVCLCATAAAMLGRVRTSQAMDMICFLYRVISSSSKGAMSSSDKVLLLKSGGSAEFCFLLYGYVSTRAALYPGCDTNRRSPGILWILSPRKETEQSSVSRVHFKGGCPRLPSSKCNLSRIVLDLDFAHQACRKSPTNTSTMDRAVVLPSRSRSIRHHTVVSFGLWVYMDVILDNVIIWTFLITYI